MNPCNNRGTRFLYKNNLKSIDFHYRHTFLIKQAKAYVSHTQGREEKTSRFPHINIPNNNIPPPHSIPPPPGAQRKTIHCGTGLLLLYYKSFPRL